MFRIYFLILFIHLFFTISAFYGMEIPYGKREFIAEEEEQQQQQPAVQPAPPIEESSIQVTQENCHAPPLIKWLLYKNNIHMYIFL